MSAFRLAPQPSLATVRLPPTVTMPSSLQVAPRVSLSAYTPTMSGNWAVYEIPLDDFLGQAVALDLTNVLYLGFWNARNTSGALTFGTLYFDDIHLAGGG